MSYEPNAHEVQMKILREMLFEPKSTFAALQKSTGLTSDHANFHIKKLVEVGYIEKTTDGYLLTRDGKEYANRMDTDEMKIEKQPKTSVLLVIENDKGEVLSQERLKQPYYGFWGRQSGKMRWGEHLLEAAARELKEETGLTADLQFAGIYHKMDYLKNGELLEDKYFFVVYGTDPQGELITDMEGHHNEWLTVDELVKKDKVFASIPEITAFGRAHTGGFIEKHYTYDADEY